MSGRTCSSSSSRCSRSAATAIERLHPDDVTALAYHYAAAGSAATAPAAAGYAPPGRRTG